MKLYKTNRELLGIFAKKVQERLDNLKSVKRKVEISKIKHEWLRLMEVKKNLWKNVECLIKGVKEILKISVFNGYIFKKWIDFFYLVIKRLNLFLSLNICFYFCTLTYYSPIKTDLK